MPISTMMQLLWPVRPLSLRDGHQLRRSVSGPVIAQWRTGESDRDGETYEASASGAEAVTPITNF